MARKPKKDLASEKIKEMKSKEQKQAFPDLTGDGKVTQADILKGRGVNVDKKD